MDDQTHVPWVMVTCVLESKAGWKKQQDEKHEGIHCFYSSRCPLGRRRRIVKPRCSTAHLLLFSCYSITTRVVFSDKHAVEFSICKVWHHPKLLQNNHTTFRMERLWDGWVERMECLYFSRTPMKTSRLWVPSTHYPCAAHTGSPGFLFQISLIYSGLGLRPSLPPPHPQPFNLLSPDWSAEWPPWLLFHFIYCSRPQRH